MPFKIMRPARLSIHVEPLAYSVRRSKFTLQIWNGKFRQFLPRRLLFRIEIYNNLKYDVIERKNTRSVDENGFLSVKKTACPDMWGIFKSKAKFDKEIEE